MDLVTVQVRVGSLGGALAGTFIIHALALKEGNRVRAEAGGVVLPISEVVWLGGVAPAIPGVHAIVVVTP